MNQNNDIAIHVANLSKEFKIYSHPSDMFLEMVRGKPRHKSFWALNDVSFDVPRGQVMGILGRNGAGKSTLLKIISGTLDKTSGEVSTHGRISSILELGTGFSGDYSGRENIYLGGLMVGLSREEIKAKEDWIIEFSELREFIDQPFKTYSTGMQARLTFSTAVCIDPDILIVDEALSVGDARFAKKSFGKIEEFRDAGNTILLVSHDPNTIREICDVAMLLEKGHLIDLGKPNAVSKHYWRMLFFEQEPPATEVKDELVLPKIDDEGQGIVEAVDVKPEEEKRPDSFAGIVRAGDHSVAEVIDLGIINCEGKKVNWLESGQKCSFFIEALFHRDCQQVDIGFHITNIKGVIMFGITSTDAKFVFPPVKSGQILTAKLNVTMWLTNGTYLLSGGIGNGDTVFDFIYDFQTFEIPRLPWIQHASVVNLEPVFEFLPNGIPHA